jgi:hypothetical protein
MLKAIDGFFFSKQFGHFKIGGPPATPDKHTRSSCIKSLPGTSFLVKASLYAASKFDAVNSERFLRLQSDQ